MPRKLDAKKASIYDAEATALLGIICSQPREEAAPAVTDSQNVVGLVARGASLPTRKALKGRNIPPGNRIRRRMAAMGAAGPPGGGPSAPGNQMLPNSGSDNICK